MPLIQEIMPSMLVVDYWRERRRPLWIWPATSLDEIGLDWVGGFSILAINPSSSVGSTKSSKETSPISTFQLQSSPMIQYLSHIPEVNKHARSLILKCRLCHCSSNNFNDSAFTAIWNSSFGEGHRDRAGSRQLGSKAAILKKAFSHRLIFI